MISADMTPHPSIQLRALDTLISATNHLHVTPSAPLQPLVRTSAATAASKPQPITLARGVAAVPLHGIDVPFHSTFLRSGVQPFRNLLSQFIKKEKVDPKLLVGKYIPNLTGKPFEVSRAYFEEVAELTGSEEIGGILQNVSLSFGFSFVIVGKNRGDDGKLSEFRLTPLLSYER